MTRIRGWLAFTLGDLRSFYELLFVGSLFLLPFANIKILQIGPWFTLGAGTALLSPLIYQTSLDLINWQFGKKAAKALVARALILKLLFFGIVIPVIMLWGYPDFWAKKVQAYNGFMGQAIQLTFAGELTILVRMYFIDTWVFDRLKKWGWLPSSFGSDAVGEIVGTTIRTVIGYGGLGYPLFGIIWSTCSYRLILAGIKALLFWPLVRFLKRS